MKIKLTKQLDETDCGAACLQMISDSYGHKESLISIKDKIYVSIYGVSMLNIARGAEAMGFKTLSVMASLKCSSKNVDIKYAGKTFPLHNSCQ